MSRERDRPTSSTSSVAVTEGRTLLVVEHDMSVVFTLCDQVSVLVYGEIIASGEPAAVRADREGAGSLSRRGSTLMANPARSHRSCTRHYDKSHILHGVSL